LPVSSSGTPARKNCSELGNAALPVLDSGQGGDAEVEEALAKLLAGWLGRRRREELGRRGRSTAELAEAKWRRERALERRNEDGRGSGWRRGVQVKAPGLTGGVAVDVRPPRVVHASAGRRLTKLNRTIQSSSTVSETGSSPTFYSQLTRWFWLKLVPLDRATRVLQLWLQDQSLTRSGFQTTKLQTSLGRNCAIQHLAKFG
jgi:hypothetical protein